NLLRPGDQDEDDAAAAYPLVGSLVDVISDPAGRWLATLTEQMELDIWDAATGRLNYRHRGTAPIEFRSSWDHLRAFSPDGRWIAVCDWDGTLLVWDASNGRPLHGLGLRQADLVFAAAGPNGPVVVFREHSGTVTAWDVVTRRRLAVMPPARQVTGDVAGNWLGCLDEQGTAWLWYLATGQP